MNMKDATTQMTTNTFLDKFWRYYLILEERFESSTRYVELCADNYSTYSIDFVNQIQTIGSEIDVIMKSMCGFGSKCRKYISDYACQILKDYPDIVNCEVKAGDILFKPFGDWSVENPAKSLSWWEAYNSVKHGRTENFKKANLKNVLNSLMALYLLEMLYFKKLADIEGSIDILTEDSKMFHIVGWKTKYISAKGMFAQLIG